MKPKNQIRALNIKMDHKLHEWLKQKATAENCSISYLVRELLFKCKTSEEHPKELPLSPELQIKSAKISIMTYRLMELLASELVDNGAEFIDKAAKISKKDFAGKLLP